MPLTSTPATRFQPFDYLRFAKTEMQGAAHELCMSGVPSAAPEDLGDARPETRQSVGGDLREEWQALVAARWGLPADQLLPSLGASGGVYLSIAACATLVRDRDGGTPIVAIERPAYAAFEVAAHLAGAAVIHVDRPRDADFALAPESARAAFEAGARIFCVTNLHNPSCVALGDDVLPALRSLAREYDAWVILDEVYRDFLPGDVGSDYVAGERIICTSSLTKCYGLGGARAGWIAAPPDVLDRAEALVEITHGVDPMPAGDVAIRGLRHADELLGRGRAAARRGRRVMDAWIAATPDVDWVAPAGGITGLVRVAGMTDSMAVARRLRHDLDVQVVPGAFFGADDALRISFGLPPAQLARALETLALGLGVLLR